RCTCVAPAVKSFSTSSNIPPKRPMTGYLRFVKQQQPIVIKQNPDVKIVDITRKIAQAWRMLSPEEKRPFQEAALAAREQYKEEVMKYKEQQTPAQTAALKEEHRQKLAKRKAIRKKRELTMLGKPKQPRSSFNIFMAEHFEEAKGGSMQMKLKSLIDDWQVLHASQKQVYMQLAEDDRIRYKNEKKSWEEHMIEIGREDLIRRKKRPKATAKSKGINKPKVKSIKKVTAKSAGAGSGTKKAGGTGSGAKKVGGTDSGAGKSTRRVKKAEE
ncbi:TFAM factor, partial [Amia calva]|nr:TFAM factor [Amia calva]